MSDSVSKKKSFHYGYLIVASCCAGVVPVSFGVSCTGLLYTSVAESMNVGVGLISYYASTLMLVSAIFLPFAGRLFNKVDARIITSFGCVAIGCGLIVCSFAQTPTIFFVGGGLVGLGVATQMYLMAPVLINRWFAKRSGFFIGFCSAFMGICTAIVSPIIGNVLLATNWHTTIMGMGIVCMVISLPFTIFVVRSRPSDKGLDPYGASAQEAAAARGETEMPGLTASEAFKTPAFILFFLFVLVLGIGMYTQAMNPNYIKQLPLSQEIPTLFATAASALMVVQVIVKLTVGAVAEKHPLAIGVAMLAIGCVGFIVNVVGSTSAVAIIAAACCIGAYTAIINVLNPIITKKLFGLKDYSSIYSIVGVAISISGVLQAPVLGTLLDATSFTTLQFALAIISAIAAVLLTLTLAAGRKIKY